VRIDLRYPATPDNASEHAELAVAAARRGFEHELDYSEASVDLVDAEVESWRDEGLTGEDVAEQLFVLGCYVGEVMVRLLAGRWVATLRSPLQGISPWPMVVALPSGATWDPIGKVYKRLELGDSEYLPAYFSEAAASAGP
jgi:hypothetical protein